MGMCKVAKSLFLLFNHRLTKFQENEACTSLGVGHIINLPAALEEIWCQIPPDLPEISGYLAPIKTWLSEQASESDYVLVQGDFGATFIMVNFAFEKGLIPIYSTTLRKAAAEQKADGSVKMVHQFNHQLFRKYGD